MVKMKKRKLIVKDAMFESGSEQSDVRVTYPPDLTVEQALKAGIMLGTEFMIHADLGGVCDDELRELGVRWKCMRIASAPA